MESYMKYCFYLRLNTSGEDWVKVGESHEIQWDSRDLIKASSGWLIVNQEKAGIASEFIPMLHRGILELKNSPQAYMEYELSQGPGTIKNILAFYQALLRDCQEFPYSELCGGIAT
jgi:hypothetical protein